MPVDPTGQGSAVDLAQRHVLHLAFQIDDAGHAFILMDMTVITGLLSTSSYDNVYYERPREFGVDAGISY